VADKARNEWVRRVLGVEPDTGSDSVDVAALTMRLTALRDGIAAGGSAAADLVADLRGVAEAVRAKAPQAPALLEALETKFAALPKAVPGDTGEELELSGADLVEQLKQLSYDAHAAGLLPVLVGDVRSAQAAVKEKRPDARELVAAVQERFAKLREQSPDQAAEQRRKEAAEEIARGQVNAKTKVVAFAKIRLKVLEVESAVDLGGERLKQAYRAVLDSELFEDEEELVNDPELQAAIEQAPAEQIPDFAATAAAVKSTLDDMVNATGDARAALAAEAAKDIRKYRGYLATANAAKAMESGEGGSFPILQPILDALGELENALTA
jgi:hypothetical protein